MRNQISESEQEFFYNAEIVPTNTILQSPDYAVMKNNAYCVVVNLPENKRKIVNFCSDVYGLINNSEIFPQIELLLDEKYRYETTYKHYNHCVFWADYKIQNEDIIVGVEKDKVIPMLRIIHSYNGTVRFQAIFGFYRQICTNGLWALSQGQKFEYRHIEKNKKKIFDVLQKDFRGFLKSISFNPQYLNDLAYLEIDNFNSCVDDISKNLKISEKKKQQVLDRIKYEQKETNLPFSAWLVYNSFNFVLNSNSEFTIDVTQKMKLDTELFTYLNRWIEEVNNTKFKTIKVV